MMTRSNGFSADTKSQRIILITGKKKRKKKNKLTKPMKMLTLSKAWKNEYKNMEKVNQVYLALAILSAIHCL